MKTKVTKKAKAASKSAPEKVIPTDPFADTVETPPSKKRAVKVVKAAAKGSGSAPKRVTKEVETPVIEMTSDAFAERVVVSSPVKKATAAKGKQAEKKVQTAAAKTTKKRAVRPKEGSLDITPDLAATEPEVELSPVFKALADVTLPELDRENRARLLMQSPTKLYFYWSVRENPWHQLKAIFGDDLGSYTLVLKLLDLKRGTEEITPCDAAGNWWFTVEPDGEYQAEIGFYATNRPYFRVMYSNKITTPRRSPSPRRSSEAEWTVSANKFAEVLDVAGFSLDAVDVAMAGDDIQAAEDVTHTAFADMVGHRNFDLGGISAEDVRYAMLALASGLSLEELRSRVSPALFAILQANAGSLAASHAQSALTEYFDIDEAEFTEEEFGSAVFGASLVHFPKTLKSKKVVSKSGATFAPRYNPVSSHSLGR
ncbi:MAG: DUF4912 domain-containing protein [Pyrinomonadaceae bacterium]